MAVIKTILKKTGTCQWCAKGECWSHGQKGKGAGKSGKGIICNTCGKPGHKSPDCFQGAKGAGKFGGGIICNTCGKPGHKSPDCFQGAKGAGKWGGGGIICNTCGTPGHKSPDCFQGAKGAGKWGGGGIICNTCGKPGHKSPDCFQGAKGAGKWGGGGIICNTCGKPGHKSPDCFQGAKGFGKGKGKRKTDPEKTVWIGGLPADEASTERNKELLEHMKQAGDCKYVKVGKSGTGCAGFASAEDAQNAIATMNGVAFNGSAMEVDVWTKKED